MMHAITNHGPRAIKVTDAKGIVWTVLPGQTSHLDMVRVWHGDGPAHYAVEPILPAQEHGQ